MKRESLNGVALSLLIESFIIMVTKQLLPSKLVINLTKLTYI
jgi:hypothetical protein